MDGFRARMERVAVITDIHANLPALEAVLDAIEWIDQLLRSAAGGHVDADARRTHTG